MEEILKIIDCLKIGKSPDVDGNKIETLKAMGTEVHLQIQRMSEAARESGTAPRNWQTCLIVPFLRRGTEGNAQTIVESLPRHTSYGLF